MTNSFDFTATDEDSGVTYTPWTDGWGIGFIATRPDGAQCRIALNPSGGSDDDVPCVFVYIDSDPSGDLVGATTHYDLTDDFAVWTPTITRK